MLSGAAGAGFLWNCGPVHFERGYVRKHYRRSNAGISVDFRENVVLIEA
jgi:hypothetical protein